MNEVSSAIKQLDIEILELESLRMLEEIIDG